VWVVKGFTRRLRGSPLRHRLLTEMATNTNMHAGEPGFFTEPQILTRVPVSRRTWYDWKQKGIIPYIKLGRRCLYDWESVRSALLRHQRGEGASQ
jgi:hypothetical protein